MEARHIDRLETGVDYAAAAILSAAAAYAMLRLGWSPAVAAIVAGAALLASSRILTSVSPGSPTFSLASFDTATLPETEGLDELILTDGDRLDAGDQSEHVDELVLDDVLAKLEDLSRVVRLFDASAMPSPGELKHRIDRHLDGASPSSPPPDASQALHDALSELRRTLR
jgi:hypothetical protein